MKNREILAIVEARPGFLSATGHSLPVEHFYKFVKFKRAVRKAWDAISKAQNDFIGEIGIDINDFSSPERIPLDKATRYSAMNGALLDEEAEMPTVAKIPMECYKGFYDENRTENGDLFADIVVENIILENLFSEEE